jgi:hypothetical protein
MFPGALATEPTLLPVDVEPICTAATWTRPTIFYRPAPELGVRLDKVKNRYGFLDGNYVQHL